MGDQVPFVLGKVDGGRQGQGSHDRSDQTHRDRPERYRPFRFPSRFAPEPRSEGRIPHPNKPGYNSQWRQ